MFNIITIAIFGLCVLASWVEKDEILRNYSSKFLKLSLIVYIVITVLSIIIPSREAMYAMLVVDQLTPENIEALRDFGVETVQQLGDAIANSINKIEVK